MKSKPWHRLVDEMISERPRTTKEVHSALENYYFTPIFNSQTRRSVPRRGRAFFPRFSQVRGYLTHSGKFHQSSHQSPWKLKPELRSAENFQAPVTNKEGYELRPIGWRPGTGYRDEATPSDEIYRTFEEAVDWIREKERSTYQRELDSLLQRPKILVTNIEYAGFINDEDLSVAGGDYFFEGRRRNIPSGYESPFYSVTQGLHEAYYFYPGHRWSLDTQEYILEPIPSLPEELLLTLGGDDGSHLDTSLGGAEHAVGNYVELLSKGEEGRYMMPYRGELTFVDFSNEFRLVTFEDTDGSLENIIAFFESNFTDAIALKIVYRTGGVPIAFDWDIVDNYLFDKLNPQIFPEGVLRASDELSDRVHDGLWLTEVANLQYKSSDAWDCTQDMNVDTGAEYRERMLYGGCAGNSATYFTYPGGGNYPYYVEPVVLDL